MTWLFLRFANNTARSGTPAAAAPSGDLLCEDEPRYATLAEIAARLEPHPDAVMLLTAVSEAVERYDPSSEAAIALEVASGYQVLILSPEGYDYVSGLTFDGTGLEDCQGPKPSAGRAQRLPASRPRVPRPPRAGIEKKPRA